MSIDTISVEFNHAFADARFDIGFTAPASGITALFGRSGAGKSTIINAISGLLRPNTAKIVLRDGVMHDSARKIFVPPERRRIGLVFQDSRLFPHMNIAANLRYGMRRQPNAGINFDDVVALLGIAPLLRRRPSTLSGGEKQRVAIGRALLSQPRLLVMDEPMAALDAERRQEILPYLIRLKQAAGVPILYVSHDLREVAQLADILVLVRAGKVVASGPIAELAARPDLPLAARADGGAVLQGVVSAHSPERQLSVVRAAGRDWLVPLLTSPLGMALRLRLPAREIVLATNPPTGISIQNVIPGTIGDMVIDAAAHLALVRVDFDGGGIIARVTPDTVQRLGLHRGVPILSLIKSVAIEILGSGSSRDYP